MLPGLFVVIVLRALILLCVTQTGWFAAPVIFDLDHDSALTLPHLTRCLLLTLHCHCADKNELIACVSSLVAAVQLIRRLLTLGVVSCTIAGCTIPQAL